jgi:hypothetical protein
MSCGGDPRRGELCRPCRGLAERSGGLRRGTYQPSLSGCFRNRDGSYAGDYTSRYRKLCAHLGVIATRNNRGVAHENGAIE